MGIDLYIYRVAKQNAINDLKMLNENSDNVLEIAYFKNDTKLKEWFEARNLRAHVSVSDESDYATSYVVVEQITS